MTSQALTLLGDPYIQVMYAFVAGVAAIYALIGLWAAVSTQHWFLRAAVPCLALAALIPIRAHEPLLFYALVMSEIVLALLLWRVVRRFLFRASQEDLPPPSNDGDRSPSPGRRRFRFGVRDLLMAMVIVGIVAWIGTGFRAVPLLIMWANAVGISMLLAGLTLAAWRLAADRQKLLSLVVLVLVLSIVVVMDLAFLGHWLEFGSLLMTHEQFSQWKHDLPIMTWLYLEFTSFLLVGTTLGRSAFRSSMPRTRLAARFALAIATAAMAIPLGTLYWRMAPLPPMPPSQFANVENAYPRIVELGRPMELAPPPRARAIYAQLKPLLDQPGYVPLNYSDPFTRRVASIQQVRSIARAIDAQGDALDAQGNHEAAVEYSASILKLAGMQSRGGLAIDTLVGHALESTARHRLVQHRADYSRETKQRIVKMLLDFDGQRETLDRLMERDVAFAARSERWVSALEDQLPYELFGLASHSNLGIVSQLRDAVRRQQTGSRLLATDLAIRLFRHEHGRMPMTLDELVPEYLPAVPADPFAGKPLIYRAEDNGFLLYGVGFDGVDNGGKPRGANQSHAASGIDYTLDYSEL